MSAHALMAATVNTVGGFGFGALLVNSGFTLTGLLVIVLGFMAGMTILGDEIKRRNGK